VNFSIGTVMLKLSAHIATLGAHLHWLAGAAVLALAAGGAQTASATPFGGGPMGHPGHVERLLGSIDTSAEQKSQIQQILQSAKVDIKAQREAARLLQDQGAALFTQPSVDARAAEALRQQMLAQHDQSSKRWLQALLDVSRVLSPEQRKAVAERMSQRRSMMERHRSERDGLDKPPR
jgi:periplasmic protein CpxP/Spy